MHVITRFDKGGSAENTFLTLRDLDRARYGLALVTGAASPANSPSHSSASETDAIKANLSALKDLDISVIALPHLVREPNFFADAAAFFSLISLIRREKPRIVHTHTSKAGILGRWAAWLCRVPVIVHTPHGHVFWGYFGSCRTRLFIALERWTARITTMLVMLTEREKADHLRFRIAPEEKFTVIHSGVDLNPLSNAGTDISQIKRELNLPDRSFVVGTLGRLTPIKGHIHMLAAAAKIVPERPDIFFVLVGEGELREALQKFAAEAGIAKNVRFPGWRSDVAALLSVLDIFCLPSLNEGMGKAIVEAMAMGKPVIASDVGGIPDLVAPGENGILVPPGDSNALAEAILNLCDHPELREKMGEQGKKKAPEYSVEKMLHKIELLYTDLLGHSAHS